MLKFAALTSLLSHVLQASPTESQEIEFLSLLCDKISKEPHLVQVSLDKIVNYLALYLHLVIFPTCSCLNYSNKTTDFKSAMIKPNEPIISFMVCLMIKDSPFKTINLYYKAQKQYGRYSVFIKNRVFSEFTATFPLNMETISF